MVKALEFQEAIGLLDSILSSCFEIFEQENPNLTQYEINNIERINFNLHGSCDEYFIREIYVYLKKCDNNSIPFWEGKLKNLYKVSNIVLVGPWECLDKFLAVAQRKDNLGYVKFLLDGIDEGLISESSS